MDWDKLQQVLHVTAELIQEKKRTCILWVHMCHSIFYFCCIGAFWAKPWQKKIWRCRKKHNFLIILNFWIIFVSCLIFNNLLSLALFILGFSWFWILLTSRDKNYLLVWSLEKSWQILLGSILEKKKSS